MQINSYLHSHNRVWVNKNIFQRNPTNLLTSGIQTSSVVISRLNTDTYIPSCPVSQLKASDLSDLSRQNIIRDWEKRKQESGDDLFKYSSSQHLVFAEKLQQMGFFDGMSEEKKEQIETLLRHITNIMNSVSDHQGGFTDAGNSDSDDIVYYYGENL